MTMASSKKLTEHEEHRLTEGILDNIFKLVLKGKLKQIEKMGIADDLKALARDTDRKVKKARKSLAKAKRSAAKLPH